MVDIKREIAVKDFYGPGRHIYTDELGFREIMLSQARTLVAREAFRYHIEEVGLNLAFYYPATDTFYGIHTESIPVRVKILPRHVEWSDYKGWQYDSDTHDEGIVIATFDSSSDIWDNLIIDGRPFEQVIIHSYITALN